MLFHWLVVLLVVGQWLGAQTIDWFPKGSLRIDMRSLHIVFGLVLGGVLAARIVWRLTGGRQLPPADRGVLQTIAKATHWGLYALVAAMVLVGLALEWARGDNIFNLFTIPAYSPGNRALAEQVQGIHATIGWMIIALAGLHAGAAIVHRTVWHDGVLARMLPNGWLQARP
jgi:cytochrome b561